jgi:hypothetical protein
MLIIILWRGKNMNKKIILLSLAAVALVLLTGFTPALASPKNNLLALKNDLVTIEVNHYIGRQTKQIQTKVTVQDAEEIRQYLKELYDARERNDHQAILKYETLLNQKGIFGDSYQNIYSKTNSIPALKQTKLQSYFATGAGENISNNFCYFNALGEGIVAWWLAAKIWEGIVRIIKNASSAIVALILYIIFLPIFVVTLLLTNLIPFRILTPVGILYLRNGTISTLGANGLQRVTVGEEGFNVNLSWFTGITINILPTENRKSFLFVSGFALKAEGETA